jgi:hypothetical protein
MMLSVPTLGLGPSTSPSQYYDNEYLSPHPNLHHHQIHKVNGPGFSWGTDLWGSSADNWATYAAPLSRHHLDSSPQERPQWLTPIQSEDTDMACFPTNAESTLFETGIKTGGSTKWTCLKNIAHHEESESVTNVKMESRHHTPITSESSITALDSVDTGNSLNSHGLSSPSSNLLTERTACDDVPDLEPAVELPPVPQYDACFGVVSHRGINKRF